MSDIRDTVDELRKHAATFTNELDKINIPTKYNLVCDQQFTYLSDGEEITDYTTSNTLLLVKNPPYKYNFNRTNIQDSLLNMISNDEIRPFLLFVNGKFINWSDIDIIEDYDYTYFVINNTFAVNPRIDCILLPDKVVYNEGYDHARVIPTTYIGFKYDGTLDATFSRPYVTLEFDDSIYSENFDIADRHQASLDYKYRINDDNILLFTNSLLNTVDTVTNKGLNVIDVSNKATTHHCILFSNKYESGDMDNVMSVENKSIISTALLNSTIGSNMNRYLQRFDFSYDRKKSYEQNISDSIQYIMSYNPNLMNLHFEDISNVKSVYYSGKELKDIIESDGYVSIPRSFNDYSNNQVIIYKNGFLYDKYNMLYIYQNKLFKFPLDISTTADTDVFEIQYFINTDNSVHELYVDSTVADNTFIVDPSFDVSQSKLFSIDGHDKEFPIRTSKFAQYEVGFTCERVDEDKVRFVLDDAWYYDKDLSLVSKRDFRYTRITDIQIDGGYKLPFEFRYANDISRYIVFINGRKIDRENFKITDVKPTRPFVNISIYFNFVLRDGDIIDVFYIPEVMEEILISPTINTDNTVVVDRSKIKYGLDKNVYMIFINGKKLNNNQVVNISANKILLRNIDSRSNISIVKYIQDDELLSTLFSSNDLLSDIVNNLSSTQFNSVYNNGTIAVADTGISRDMMDNSRVLYQIVRDFYTRPFVSIDDLFLYDYYTDDNIVYDHDGNIIFNLND